MESMTRFMRRSSQIPAFFCDWVVVTPHLSVRHCCDSADYEVEIIKYEEREKEGRTERMKKTYFCLKSDGADSERGIPELL